MMRSARIAVALAALVLGACALAERMPWGDGEVLDRATLTPADAATTLIAGGPLAMQLTTPRQDPPAGEDPVLTLTLTREDGRDLSFQSANHAPLDLMAQAPGGPLAQAMGLFGSEAPSLYNTLPNQDERAAFICPPAGPQAIGVYATADGAVAMVGLKSSFQFEVQEDGGYLASPVSPDIVCARMNFTRGQ